MTSKRRTTIKTVAVIGAGVSGLAAIKSCLEVGLEPMCFESRPNVGGIWSGQSGFWDDDGPKMYPSLLTNTSKSLTCFSDFPCPAHYPPYMPYELFNEYLELYADHFKLRQYIQFNTKVQQVVKAKDNDATGRWQVRMVAAGDGDLQTTSREFDAVMVCAGYFSKPAMPDIPGMEHFRGQILHSKDYRNPSPFEGQTVLVVGNASSAGDIAAEVSHVATQVYMSVGDGTAVLSRITPSCLPSDFGLKRILVWLFPLAMLRSLFLRTAEQRWNHRRLGFLCTSPSKQHCPILLNDDLPVRIISGKVKVIGHVTSIEPSSVSTDDGQTFEGIDTIIFATGYSRDLSLLDPELKCGDAKLEMYKQVFPIADRNNSLAIIGCLRLGGPIPPVLELQARMAAYIFSGRNQLPSSEVMVKDVLKRNRGAVRPDGTYKYSYISIIAGDEIAQEIGVLPSLWKLVLTGRLRLAYQFLFGPQFPFHYRITGHGSWPGAAEAIAKAPSENTRPLLYRKVLERDTSVPFWKLVVSSVIVVLIAGTVYGLAYVN